MKWKMTSDGKCMVPVLTKGWKARWFIGGLFLNILATLFAFFLYRKTLPNIPTVAKVAVKWTLYGCVCMCLIGMFFSLLQMIALL